VIGGNFVDGVGHMLLESGDYGRALGLFHSNVDLFMSDSY